MEMHAELQRLSTPGLSFAPRCQQTRRPGSFKAWAPGQSISLVTVVRYGYNSGLSVSECRVAAVAPLQTKRAPAEVSWKWNLWIACILDLTRTALLRSHSRILLARITAPGTIRDSRSEGSARDLPYLSTQYCATVPRLPTTVELPYALEVCNMNDVSDENMGAAERRRTGEQYGVHNI
jgi:hypothetical protein